MVTQSCQRHSGRRDSYILERIPLKYDRRSYFFWIEKDILKYEEDLYKKENNYYDTNNINYFLYHNLFYTKEKDKCKFNLKCERLFKAHLKNGTASMFAISCACICCFIHLKVGLTILPNM